MAQAGIYDATSVQKAAVYAAIASAGLALTVDVLVPTVDDRCRLAVTAVCGRLRCYPRQPAMARARF